MNTLEARRCRLLSEYAHLLEEWKIHLCQETQTHLGQIKYLYISTDNAVVILPYLTLHKECLEAKQIYQFEDLGIELGVIRELYAWSICAKWFG